MNSIKFRRLCALAVAAGVLTTGARAQSTNVLAPGDAVVTGFSGIAAPTETNPALSIDLSGPSAQIMSFAGLSGAPKGVMTGVPSKRKITAKEVGQVFAIALDDGGPGDEKGKAPNIYLGATALFGLYIIEGGGTERLDNGEPGARFMEGQFGPDGAAGSIWRVDGATGEITEFARLPDNTGAGVGDVVFDPKTRQFFASDLDNGKIYRISEQGAIIDSFDHGVDGRQGAGMQPVADDGSKLNIEDIAFDANAPETWGYTPTERRVQGMAINNGRLYYATEGTPQIWSIGIAADGSLAGDATLEFEVADLAGSGPITDMLFDASGKLYLAQRGLQKASFNFSEFAEPGQSTVLRYAKVDGEWEPAPASYAIGLPPENNASNGGIALGYKIGAQGIGQCGGTLW